MALSEVPNDELAALNNAVQTWGVVNPLNKGYRTALDLEIINTAGRPIELEAMRDGLANQVNRRVAAGTFN
jgi:hypothetical protein